MAGSVSASACATPPAPDISDPLGDVTSRALGLRLCHVPMLKELWWVTLAGLAGVTVPPFHATNHTKPLDQGHSHMLLVCSPWCSWGHPFLAPRSHAPALCPQPDASRLLDENKKSLPSSSPGARWSLQENQLRKVAVVSLISQSAQARGVSSSMSHPKQEGSSVGDMGPLSRELPAPSPGAS